MENMDKGLTVPKWVLKIPQMPQNLFAKFVCPKVLDFNEKRLEWSSIVHGQTHPKINKKIAQETVQETS